MSELLTSTDPSKKVGFTSYPVSAAPPKENDKDQPAVDLEYVPAGPTAQTLKPTAPPLTSIDPSVWPQNVLERNYTAMRTRLAKSPDAVTAEDRTLFARMEAVLHERQGSAIEKPAKPKTAVTMLADSGVTLSKGIEKAHMTTAEVEKYVAEYTACSRG